MTARPHLRAVVDGETGELFAQPCPRCQDVELGDLENAERHIRKLERLVTALERDRQAERERDPERKQILKVIEKWAQLTGHPKANVHAADRFDYVKARRAEKYEFESIELAVEGIAARPYVVNGQRIAEGNRSQRHDRLGICLGSGEQLEKFAVYGYEARKEREATNDRHDSVK